MREGEREREREGERERERERNKFTSKQDQGETEESIHDLGKAGWDLTTSAAKHKPCEVSQHTFGATSFRGFYKSPRHKADDFQCSGLFRMCCLVIHLSLIFFSGYTFT